MPANFPASSNHGVVGLRVKPCTPPNEVFCGKVGLVVFVTDAPVWTYLDNNCNAQVKSQLRSEQQYWGYRPSEPRCGTRESSLPEYIMTEMPCLVTLVASSDRKAIGLR